LTISMPQNLKRLTFQSMVWTNYGDVTWELVEVGSVWRSPSITFSIICCYRKWPDGFKMMRLCICSR
jgi:hypothetical protein